MSKSNIVIVGAGINGLALALLLNKFGIVTHIYEQSPEPRVTGTGIYIWPNGIAVLNKIFPLDQLDAIGQKIQNLNTSTQYGELIHCQPTPQTEFIPGQAYMFHRHRLYNLMLSYLKKDQLILNKKVIHVEQNKQSVHIIFSDGTDAQTDLLIATDGLYSQVRQAIFPEIIPRYSHVSVTRGITSYAFQDLDNYECNIYAGDYSRIVTYPTKTDLNERYWFAAYYNKNKTLLDKNALLVHFKEYHESLLKMIQNTPNENTIASHLYYVPIKNNWCRGRTILLGDAAHAILPTLGYGFSLGLENVLTLANLITKYQFVPKIREEFEFYTLKRTKSISDVSRRITTLFYKKPHTELTRFALDPLYKIFFNQISYIPYLATMDFNHV